MARVAISVATAARFDKILLGACACVRQRRFRQFVLITALTTTISAPGTALEISRLVGCVGGDVLRLRGPIDDGDFAKFRSHFGDPRRIVGLDLHSGGGSLYEGVRIAALARQKRLATFVAKECDSACAFIFLLGTKRYIGKDAKIGVHAVGNEYGNEDNGAVRDTIYFARLSAKLGIPSSTIGKMVATPPGKITYLDQADLLASKVTMHEPFARKGREGDQKCSSGSTEEPSAAAETSIARTGNSYKPESPSGRRAGLQSLTGRSDKR
jgi:hypothetical protein